MPRIEPDEAKKGCPGCKTLILPKLRYRTYLDKESGERKFGGTYYTCRCGALSLGDSGFNLNYKRLELK